MSRVNANLFPSQGLASSPPPPKKKKKSGEIRRSIPPGDSLVLGVVVDDKVVHGFGEKFAGHGDTDGRVHLVTGEHPDLTDRSLEKMGARCFGRVPVLVCWCQRYLTFLEGTCCFCGFEGTPRGKQTLGVPEQKKTPKCHESQAKPESQSKPDTKTATGHVKNEQDRYPAPRFRL